jgi:hypothetical protein
MKSILEYLTEDYKSSVELFVKKYLNYNNLKFFLRSPIWEYLDVQCNDDIDYYYQDFGYDKKVKDLYNIVYFKDFVNSDMYEKYSEPFLRYVISRIRDRIDSADHQISNAIKVGDGHINLYRGMSVDENFIKRLSNGDHRVGIYWTIDPDAAKTYNERSATGSWEVVLNITVNANHIDWENTLFARIHPMFGDEESEIRLFKGTPLRILGLDGDLVDLEDEDLISKIKSEKFYA